MAQNNLNMRLDDDLCAKAYPILAQYGLMPSQVVHLFFNQISMAQNMGQATQCVHKFL